MSSSLPRGKTTHFPALPESGPKADSGPALYRQPVGGSDDRQESLRISRDDGPDASPRERGAGSASAGPGGATYAPESESPGANPAQEVEQWLGAVRPGWGIDQLGQNIDCLKEVLRRNRISGSETTVRLLIARVAKTLRENGYRELTRKELSRVLLPNRREVETESDDNEDASTPLKRFVALSACPIGSGDGAIPQCGIVDLFADGAPPITNFEIVIEENLLVRDEVESSTVVKGRLRLAGREAPLRLTAREYADNADLRAALYTAAGTDLVVTCSMEALRNAVAELNPDCRRRQVTTNLGWTQDRAAYLAPGGAITAAGFEPAGPNSPLAVDLGDCPLAASLDLSFLPPAEVESLKRHLVQDWLRSHHRGVTFSLLGTVAASVLFPFSGGIPRYALWLNGLTGTGKSFQARLAQHFFGDFGGVGGKVQTWASTPNNIQAVGYYFRHGLYLVDDYKPSAMRDAQRAQVLALLQAYHDNTGRERLRSDASIMGSRPIRGLLVSTGEDIPEQSASTLARLVLVEVPKQGKDRNHGRRCLDQCRHYSAVTADLIRWLLARGIPGEFAERCRERRDQFLTGIEGVQNDLRIAGNLALLGASIEVFAEYLADVWPAGKGEIDRYLSEDLVAIRDRMLREANDQQESQVFLATLAELITWGRVRLQGHGSREVCDSGRPPAVGKLESGGGQAVVLLAMGLALGEVQRSLRDQGKPELRSSIPTLIKQLHEDGQAIEDTTRNVRIDGGQRKCLKVKPQALFTTWPPADHPWGTPRSATVLS